MRAFVVACDFQKEMFVGNSTNELQTYRETARCLAAGNRDRGDTRQVRRAIQSEK
jgi:hypothetical protein